MTDWANINWRKKFRFHMKERSKFKKIGSELKKPSHYERELLKEAIYNAEMKQNDVYKMISRWYSWMQYIPEECLRRGRFQINLTNIKWLVAHLFNAVLPAFFDKHLIVKSAEQKFSDRFEEEYLDLRVRLTPNQQEKHLWSNDQSLVREKWYLKLLEIIKQKWPNAFENFNNDIMPKLRTPLVVR